VEKWNALRDGLVTGISMMLVYTPNALDSVAKSQVKQPPNQGEMGHFAKVGKYIESAISAEQNALEAAQGQLELPLSS
jgi:hypothetical protein